MSEPRPDVARLYLALGRLNRALRREAPDAIVGHGALSVLATLTAAGPLRLGALAELEGVSAPSMTRIVASLEQLGHVRRRIDQDDRRAQLVEATETGSGLVTHGRAQRLVALSARLDRLDPALRAGLLAALPALEAHGEEAAASR
jgi:DNA-binding MarR family transcriptional regulator